MARGCVAIKLSQSHQRRLFLFEGFARVELAFAKFWRLHIPLYIAVEYSSPIA